MSPLFFHNNNKVHIHMFPQLKDILLLLEELAPIRFAETWDNPGLQVGDCSQEIESILLALDPTITAMEYASVRHSQLLLTHHPLVFSPINRVDMDIYPGNVIVEAVKRGVSIVAMHTNLDVAPGGINDILSELFDLSNTEVLKEIPGEDLAGLGRIGDLPTPITLSGFIKEIQRVFDTEKIGVVGLDDALIRRIAIVGGSGGDMVSLAHDKGADLLLTGDVRHHQALEALSRGIALVDAGHFHTEKTAFRIFAQRLRAFAKSKGWDIIVEVYLGESNPMREVSQRVGHLS